MKLEDLKCACGGSVIVESGSETVKQLSCSSCGFYLYYVGGICCCCSGDGYHVSRKEWEQLCGDATLLPNIAAKVKALRKGWQ